MAAAEAGALSGVRSAASPDRGVRLRLDGDPLTEAELADLCGVVGAGAGAGVMREEEGDPDLRARRALPLTRPRLDASLRAVAVAASSSLDEDQSVSAPLSPR